MKAQSLSNWTASLSGYQVVGLTWSPWGRVPKGGQLYS